MDMVEEDLPYYKTLHIIWKTRLKKDFIIYIDLSQVSL